ncbi:Protein of unknown function [Pyronema omphalodes CBS 100304]|uniref:Uncharacterized protein n=1 Tax=Pyronema omphalodes (strain CBS 100304) TaxID=1076935 RepID=U4LHE3_PYROM|nr:Protein of unknown function [Pyronema omphalodes CBS 100304]
MSIAVDIASLIKK